MLRPASCVPGHVGLGDDFPQAAHRRALPPVGGILLRPAGAWGVESGYSCVDEASTAPSSSAMMHFAPEVPTSTPDQQSFSHLQSPLSRFFEALIFRRKAWPDLSEVQLVFLAPGKAVQMLARWRMKLSRHDRQQDGEDQRPAVSGRSSGRSRHIHEGIGHRRGRQRAHGHHLRQRHQNAHNAHQNGQRPAGRMTARHAQRRGDALAAAESRGTRESRAPARRMKPPTSMPSSPAEPRGPATRARHALQRSRPPASAGWAASPCVRSTLVVPGIAAARVRQYHPCAIAARETH